MKKQLLFFKLILNQPDQLRLFNNDESTLSDKVQQLHENHTALDTVQVQDKKIFQLLSFDKNHIFGSFGKVEDLKQGDHIRGRNKNNYSIENLDHLVETFSYFYIDLTKDNIALIKRNGLPDIKKPLQEFLLSHFRISGNWEVEIVPKFTDNVESIIGKKVPVAKIKYSVENASLHENEFLSVKEAYEISSEEIEKVTVNINLKKGNETIIDKAIDKFSRFSEMKIENDEETIDIVERIITKKVTVEVESDQLKNEDEIMKILKYSLSNIL